MDEETYKQLLEKLDAQDKKIKTLEDKLTDVTSYNKALLNSRGEKPKDNTPTQEELKKKLMEGLKH